jgi:hypothetical protein
MSGLSGQLNRLEVGRHGSGFCHFSLPALVGSRRSIDTLRTAVQAAAVLKGIEASYLAIDLRQCAAVITR